MGGSNVWDTARARAKAALPRACRFLRCDTTPNCRRRPHTYPKASLLIAAASNLSCRSDRTFPCDLVVRVEARWPGSMESLEDLASLSLNEGPGAPEAAPPTGEGAPTPPPKPQAPPAVPAGPETGSAGSMELPETVDIALKQALSGESRSWGELHVRCPPLGPHSPPGPLRL
jgi:hypothetical protein